MKVQTNLRTEEVAAKLRKLGPSFYPFEFRNGAKAELLDQSALVIHESRAAGIFPVLDRHFQGRWPSVSCLDVDCHEGWFSLQMAQRGARLIEGIDVRSEWIEKANFIRNAAEFANATYRIGDLFDLTPARDGVFDLTLFLGIFYHLEDPVRGFRLVRALTKEVCVVEGQVARHQGRVTTAWGKRDELRAGPACSVIDADPNHTSPGSAICMVPSLEALQKIVRAAGFTRTELVRPTAGMHEQFLAFDRVMLFAFV
jgi:tRNA (mo5U34)-methyltransferase